MGMGKFGYTHTLRTQRTQAGLGKKRSEISNPKLANREDGKHI
jgi:hypothetical protein